MLDNNTDETLTRAEGYMAFNDIIPKQHGSWHLFLI